MKNVEELLNEIKETEKVEQKKDELITKLTEELARNRSNHKILAENNAKTLEAINDFKAQISKISNVQVNLKQEHINKINEVLNIKIPNNIQGVVTHKYEYKSGWGQIMGISLVFMSIAFAVSLIFAISYYKENQRIVSEYNSDQLKWSFNYFNYMRDVGAPKTTKEYIEENPIPKKNSYKIKD